MDSRQEGGFGVKLLIGVFITAVGILLTLDNLDFLDSEPYLAWWPVLLVTIGLVKLMGEGSRVLAIVLI
ncbi:MAG: LiaI-LiaF-like domain-containing protein, partial [Thermoanaerobaculia bacterium]